MEKDEMTLEETFRAVEEVLEALEKDDIGLEEAFTKYSEGMALLKGCNEKIDRVEKKVLVLTKEGETKEFV